MSLQQREPGVDLEVDAVVKSFGAVRAVDGVSFSVPRGHFYSLLGPSGCGKTTSLRLIAGFERPDAGRIRIRDEDVTGLPPHRRNVNTVFQHYALFPHLTVAENVGYGLKQRRLARVEARRRLAEALATVRLADLADRYPRELSGGQSQRVALARALVNEPAVLLLDEPLAALDLKLRRAMQGELKRLQERLGITFLYVTHDQEEALALSDRIAVMHDGRILQEGTPQDIYERPASRFVADFIGETNFFEGEVQDAGAVTLVRDRSGLLLRCAPAPWARPGMRVAVAVRPEKIGPASAQAGNRLTGTVVRRAYLGDLVQHHVAVAGGRELVVQQLNEGPASRWSEGAAVELGWDEDSALVVRDEGVAQEEDLQLLAEDRAGA
ncbi:MAG TPA: ABC transporter ATP-binding protein [Actinomycetota bacterium]|nr:ABC transporter ATP-binding protein [Actinomycetota bacterium]